MQIFSMTYFSNFTLKNHDVDLLKSDTLKKGSGFELKFYIFAVVSFVIITYAAHNDVSHFRLKIVQHLNLYLLCYILKKIQT